MPRALPTCLAIIGITCLIAGPSQAEENFVGAAEEPRFMLYLHKAFGSRENPATAPRLGLRFERALRPNAMITHSGLVGVNIEPTRYVALADVRWSKKGASGLWLGEQPIIYSYGESEVDLEDSKKAEKGKDGDSLSTESSGPKLRTFVFAGLGIIGIACLAEVGICEDDDDSSTDTYVPPPTGE